MFFNFLKIFYTTLTHILNSYSLKANNLKHNYLVYVGMKANKMLVEILTVGSARAFTICFCTLGDSDFKRMNKKCRDDQVILLKGLWDCWISYLAII